MPTNEELELQALIAERDGMNAENRDRLSKGQCMAYLDGAFTDLATQIRSLKQPQSDTPPHEVDLSIFQREIERLKARNLELEKELNALKAERGGDST